MALGPSQARFRGYTPRPAARREGPTAPSPAPDTLRGMPVPETTEARYLNRALTWLGFNGRVLEEAQDPSNAILERARFLGIFASNLDEFFMVRVAGVRGLVLAGLERLAPDGIAPAEQLARMEDRSRQLVREAYATWERDIEPALREHGVRFVATADLESKERAFLDRLFVREILPVLTPAAVEPELPFPRVANLALTLAVRLTRNGAPERFALV